MIKCSICGEQVELRKEKKRIFVDPLCDCKGDDK